MAYCIHKEARRCTVTAISFLTAAHAFNFLLLQGAMIRSIGLAVLLAAMLFGSALAEPRKVLAAGNTVEDAQDLEHQRILAELEELHQLRERMLQEGESHWFTLAIPVSRPIFEGLSTHL